MKVSSLAVAAPLLALAGTAGARSFAWCQVTGDHYRTYLSDIVEIDDGPEAFRSFKSGAFGNGFRHYVTSSLSPGASDLECNKQESRFFAEDYVGILINSNPGYNFVRTGWNGLHSGAAERRPQHGKASAAREAALR